MEYSDYARVTDAYIQLYICLSPSIPSSLSIYLSIHLHTYLSGIFSICHPSISMSMYIYLSI